jgi:hypothetical protein
MKPLPAHIAARGRTRVHKDQDTHFRLRPLLGGFPSFGVDIDRAFWLEEAGGCHLAAER